MQCFDIIICGAGAGGYAAAISAAKMGKRILLTEESDWIGGQFTSQAVPPDENPWIETYGANLSYRTFRANIRSYYRNNYPLTNAARSTAYFNPGNGTVSRLCHEPRVALAVMEAELAPFISAGIITLLTRHKIIAAETSGDMVKSITTQSLESGKEFTFQSAFVLDATETGELLALTETEYVIGAESHEQTGEPHAVAGPAQPQCQQAVTHCFALSYHAGEDHTIVRPEQYDYWRDYKAEFWPGPLLNWQDVHPTTLRARDNSLFGPSDNPDLFTKNGEYTWGQQGYWHYRRLRDKNNFADMGDDVSLINWPMNDYWIAPVVDVSPEAERLARLGARQLSLSLLYWLQTEAPHPAGSKDLLGYPGLRLRPDIVGTDDGLAKALYIRESRRIAAEFTVCEQHISSSVRQSAEQFPDSVGIGCYRIDLHPTPTGQTYIDVGCHPFQIPLGSLIPVRVNNLLPACKNIGVTHITNGAYRLHPIEWGIGEASGILASYCINNNISPRCVREDPKYLADFQSLLRKHGITLEWDSLRAV